MYGLPKGFDGSMFIGKAIAQVSFGSNIVQLAFEDQLSLTIESTFEHVSLAAEGGIDRCSVPVDRSRLMQLIGKPVVEVRQEDSGTLVLRFRDGQILRCFDDKPNYECYQIYHGATVIIV